jgi:hypothetical protein
MVAGSAPDGYTFLLAPTAILAITPGACGRCPTSPTTWWRCAGSRRRCCPSPGKVRVVLIDSATRLPDVPTAQEVGFDLKGGGHEGTSS